MHALIGVIVGAWLAGGQPPDANRDVTVDQLRAVVVEAAHERDAEIARRITPLHLTERLTAAGVEKIDDALHLGPETQAALRVLADSSAFLDPPAGEIAAREAPSIPEQQAMLNAAVHFVAVTLKGLPDFFATRTTQSFDDLPTVVTHSGWAPSGPMHGDGVFDQEIAFRNGKEVVGARKAVDSGKKNPGVPPGLTSTGEFGTLQAMILRDLAHGKLLWGYWQTTSAGRVAVFQYSVPENQSHYEVDYCCVRSSEDPASYGGVGSDHSANAYHGRPGYHGTLAIDPATGAIMRFTVEALLKNSDPITEGGVAIDYGRVSIDADKSYICPVHSVAISVALSQTSGEFAARSVRRINDVTFDKYHRFGATVRMLPAGTQ